MNKLRSDSAWAKLTMEQRARLESWLFEQHLSYRKTLELVRREFGLKTSLTSLKMFFRRLAEECDKRQTTEELRALINSGMNDEATLQKLRSTGETLTTLRACQLAMQSPEKVHEFTALCRAMTNHQKADLERKKLDCLRASQFAGNVIGQDKSA